MEVKFENNKKNWHMTVFCQTEGYLVVGFCMKFASGKLRINLLLGLGIKQL